MTRSVVRGGGRRQVFVSHDALLYAKRCLDYGCTCMRHFSLFFLFVFFLSKQLQRVTKIQTRTFGMHMSHAARLLHSAGRGGATTTAIFLGFE